MTTGEGEWTVTIKRDGIWPTKWTWKVERDAESVYTLRRGDAVTKDRARRKALRAKRSMEEDDVTVRYG